MAKRVLGGGKRLEFDAAGVGILGISGRGIECLMDARDTGADSNGAVTMHCIERFWRDTSQAVKH